MIKINHCHLCNSNLNRTKCDSCVYGYYNLCQISDNYCWLGIEIEGVWYLYEYYKISGKNSIINFSDLSTPRIIINYDFNFLPDIKENLYKYISKILKMKAFI